MALIKCPECGKEVSDTAKICVHCGFKLPKIQKDGNKSKKHWILITLIVVVTIFLVVGGLILNDLSIKKEGKRAYYTEEYKDYVEDVIALLDGYSSDTGENMRIDVKLKNLAEKLKESDTSSLKTLGISISTTQTKISLDKYSPSTIRKEKEKYEEKIEELKKLYK